jgi:hypothetical protein
VNYQLVLQFRGEALERFLGLGDFEAPLRKEPDLWKIFDGIDHGGHGANLFFYTDHPADTLERIRPVLGLEKLAPGFIAAYRMVAQDTFRILWPVDSPMTFTLR